MPEVNVIPAGLRADIMRKRMEDKNILDTPGSLYVGTGESESYTDGATTVVVYKTTKLAPTTSGNGQVLMTDNALTGGLKYAKLTHANLIQKDGEYQPVNEQTYVPFNASDFSLSEPISISYRRSDISAVKMTSFGTYYLKNDENFELNTAFAYISVSGAQEVYTLNIKRVSDMQFEIRIKQLSVTSGAIVISDKPATSTDVIIMKQN